MSNATVFANEMSIAAKVCQGKSSLQMVDVCHSPGKGRPKPYKNTALASQLTNGTVSVFIGQLSVAQKDKSFFANSTGNESATTGFGMGIVTHTIKGGAYFVNWSPDVFVEGYNVGRHLDYMTHNHSNPANTGYWVYKDGLFDRNKCKDERAKVERKCDISKDRKRIKNRRNNRRSDEEPSNWKEAHCDGLNVKPDPGNLSQLTEDIQSTLNDYTELFENGLDIVEQYVYEAIEDFAVKQGIKLVARSAVGAFIPIAGWVFAAGSAAWTASELASFRTEMMELYEDFMQLREGFDELLQGDTGNTIRKLNDAVENGEVPDVSSKELADLMHAWAEMNPCIRAKRCQLQAKQPTNRKTQSTLRANRSGRSSGPRIEGCCPGQTGHHVIPNSWMVGFSACPEYTEASGLSICVEGTSHSLGGSHQLMHDSLDIDMERAGLIRLKNEATGESRALLKETISLDDAIDLAAKSIRRSFRASGCSLACLKDQMEDYYDGLCSSTRGEMPLKDHRGNAPYDVGSGDNEDI